jgi:protein NrfC
MPFKLSEEMEKKHEISKEYLVVDSEKCQGCLTCMLVCSIVHEGKENLSIAGIQVTQNAFSTYPNDLTIQQCRQCVDPFCIEACATNAIHIDRNNRNIIRINTSECIGCMSCIEACPFPTSMIGWDVEKKIAVKCDLCIGAKYWHKKDRQEREPACVKLCPMHAIQLVQKV